jgi:hypothetical protein
LTVVSSAFAKATASGADDFLGCSVVFLAAGDRRDCAGPLRRGMARQHHHGKETRCQGERRMKPDTPFPRYWLYYIILKWTVIAAAVLFTLYSVYRLL